MGTDPVQVDPKHYKVEFENERVRVLRIRYEPHEKSVMHAHPPGIAVMLKDCDFRFYLPEHNTQEIIGKAGEIISSEEPRALHPGIESLMGYGGCAASAALGGPRSTNTSDARFGHT